MTRVPGQNPPTADKSTRGILSVPVQRPPGTENAPASQEISCGTLHRMIPELLCGPGSKTESAVLRHICNCTRCLRITIAMEAALSVALPLPPDLHAQ